MLVVGPVDIRKEANEIIAFYQTHGRAHLPTPAIEALIEAATAGTLYRVDTQASFTSGRRRLVALAGLFPMIKGNGGVYVYELAGMALDGSHVGGLGPHTLQDLLLWLRVCGFAVEAAQSRSCIISTVVSTNSASNAAMGRAGLVEFSAPNWLAAAHRTWHTNNTTRVQNYVLPTTQVALYARALLKFLKSPTLSRTNSKSRRKERHTVRFTLDWLQQPILTALTKSDSVSWTDRVPDRQVLKIGDTDWEY